MEDFWASGQVYSNDEAASQGSEGGFQVSKDKRLERGHTASSTLWFDF